MPQLNPTPWFMTLIIVWTALTMLMKFALNNPQISPTNLSPKQTTNKHWPWTWQ